MSEEWRGAVNEEIRKLRERVHAQAQFQTRLGADMDGHEAVCTIRHTTINRKLNFILSVLGLATAALLTALVYYVNRYGVVP